VVALSTQIGGVGQLGTGRVELGDEAVVGVVVSSGGSGLEGSGGGGEVVGATASGDVGVAGGVDGNGGAKISLGEGVVICAGGAVFGCSRKVGRIGQCSGSGVEFADEDGAGVCVGGVGTLSLIGAACRGEFAGVGEAGEIGASCGIDCDAGGVVRPSTAEVGAVDEDWVDDQRAGTVVVADLEGDVVVGLEDKSAFYGLALTVFSW
jgi:hypothetical protein